MDYLPKTLKQNAPADNQASDSDDERMVREFFGN